MGPMYCVKYQLGPFHTLLHARLSMELICMLQWCNLYSRFKVISSWTLPCLAAPKMVELEALGKQQYLGFRKSNRQASEPGFLTSSAPCESAACR